jgi:superfamily II DNA/RNA helicase
MQEEAQLAIHSGNEIVLLSPTGTGKTLAFLLPIISDLEARITTVQAIILAPTRELAIQLEQVAREMGTGYRILAVYGGTSFSKDKTALQQEPALLIGTPGRIADHLKRRTFHTEAVKTLVLDEFDKSLEIGFKKEMKAILKSLTELSKKIMTSATQGVEIPDFVALNDPLIVNYLDEKDANLTIKRVVSPTKDKLESLGLMLKQRANKPGIVFCNFKDSIQRVSDYLNKEGIPHGCFYGGMEQRERERALIKFRNGTHQLIIATDLAARGIDIPEIQYIIHYHLPQRLEEFTHRNGRTARMHNNGNAYVLQSQNEILPDFIDATLPEEYPEDIPLIIKATWKTLYISGGRKDKISKGDLAGLFFKQGGLEQDELGMIELKADCGFVAVASNKTTALIQKLDQTRLKKKKIRVSLI